MKKTIYLLLLIIAVISFTKCYNNNEQTLYPDSSNSCDTTNITFSGKVAPILRANCMSCHSNAAVAAGDGGGIKLEDHSDVKLHLDRVYGAITHQTGFLFMPKDRTEKIDTCQIKIIRIWKEAGAP
jgi:hypothetical protein